MLLRTTVRRFPEARHAHIMLAHAHYLQVCPPPLCVGLNCAVRPLVPTLRYLSVPAVPHVCPSVTRRTFPRSCGTLGYPSVLRSPFCSIPSRSHSARHDTLASAERTLSTSAQGQYDGARSLFEAAAAAAPAAAEAFLGFGNAATRASGACCCAPCYFRLLQGSTGHRARVDLRPVPQNGMRFKQIFG